MKLKKIKNLGLLLLSIWLILTGLVELANITIPSGNVVMAIIALAAGILILLNR